MKKIFILFLVLLGVSACVKDEVVQGPPTIEAVTFLPGDVTDTDEVTVTAIVKDYAGIKSVDLTYTIKNEDFVLNMQAGVANTYTAVIPAQPDKTKVEFFVTATNTVALTTKSKKQAYKVSNQVIDYSGIVLNEIDANSKSIELYNNGNVAFSLEGFKLVKNNEGEWWIGTAESGEIAPGAYIVIIQKNPDNPNLSGNSGISNKQVLKFELLAPNGKSIGLFLRGDEEALGSTISDVSPHSYQIIPHAVGEWKIAEPTIGEKNAENGDIIPQN